MTDHDDKLERLEQLWLLPPDATPIERLLVLQPLTGAGQRHKTMLVEVDTDGSADHCRRLAAGAAPVEGPFLAIARSAGGPITVFDGMHRMAAWVAHVKEGRRYPLEVNVVVTREPSPVFELPP